MSTLSWEMVSRNMKSMCRSQGWDRWTTLERSLRWSSGPSLELSGQTDLLLNQFTAWCRKVVVITERRPGHCTGIIAQQLPGPRVAGLRLPLVDVALEVADHVCLAGDGAGAHHTVVVGHMPPRLEGRRNHNNRLLGWNRIE